MQVFRLMGMPDKVIAFDELPADLLVGFEMIKAEAFPRHWKEWMGKKTKVTRVPPERDPITGAVRKFEPIYEEDFYFYLVDWQMRPVVEKWENVCSYVKQNVSREFRILDKIDDMALPLAPDKISPIMLEPEDVVIIPLSKAASLLDASGREVKEIKIEQIKEQLKNEEKSKILVKCEEEDCTSEFEGVYARNSLRMHQKKHRKKAVA